MHVEPSDVGLRPLYSFTHPCFDRRFPRITGNWVVGCGPSGLVDRVMDVRTDEITHLEEASASPGVGDGLLYAAGPDHGLWRLPDPEPLPDSGFPSPEPIAPPATDGRIVVIPLDGRMAISEVGSARQLIYPADPWPWFPPAIAGTWVFWVNGRDGEADIWGIDLSKPAPRPVPIVTSPGDQIHVVGAGNRFGWVSDDGFHIASIEDINGESSLSPTPSVQREGGWRAPPSLDEEGYCVEWGDGPWDIDCRQDLRIEASRRAGWPSRSGRRVLFRVDDLPFLATLRSKAPVTPLGEATHP